MLEGVEVTVSLRSLYHNLVFNRLYGTLLAFQVAAEATATKLAV